MQNLRVIPVRDTDRNVKLIKVAAKASGEGLAAFVRRALRLQLTRAGMVPDAIEIKAGKPKASPSPVKKPSTRKKK